MATGRTKHKTMDEYIASFPEETREIMQRLRKTIKEAAPQAEETINYGIPTFTLKGNLVHFAAFRGHIGFYPNPSAISAFADELAAYKRAKGSVQFPLDRPLPYDLVKKIVRFRVREKQA